jgi:hypothetical protein
MSLPIAAVGPLNVLTKPIFTLFCWAGAGITAITVRMAAPTATYLNITTSRNTNSEGY